MYKNNYDTDCVTWSPQGRIYQVEYAGEAVRQGSCCVGVRSDRACVLACLKRRASKLASYQQKLFAIDDHVGAAMSGITADAKMIAKSMRTQCLVHKYRMDCPEPIGRLANVIADKCQEATQGASKRPYGVGVLLAGYDQTGPHLYELTPSGDFTELYAIAFGARCQPVNTYLEKTVQTFPKLTDTELIIQSLNALKATLTPDIKLDTENVALGIVCQDANWKEYLPHELKPFLDKIDQTPQTPRPDTPQQASSSPVAQG